MDGADAGIFSDAAMAADAGIAERQAHLHKRAKKKEKAGQLVDARKVRAAQAIAQEKATRTAIENKRELEKRQRKERALLYLDSQEMWTVEGEGNPFETPRSIEFAGSDAAPHGGRDPDPPALHADGP